MPSDKKAAESTTGPVKKGRASVESTGGPSTVPDKGTNVELATEKTDLSEAKTTLKSPKSKATKKITQDTNRKESGNATTEKTPPHAYLAPGWHRRFLDYFFVALLLLCAAVLTKRLGQADILGDQGAGRSLKSILPIADIMYYVGTAVESYFPLVVAFLLAFAAARRPNAGVAFAVLASWAGYLGSTTALSQYSAGASVGVISGIDLGIFGGIIIGFATAACWSTFRFRQTMIWARMISGIPLVIVVSATAGVLIGIFVGVIYQITYLLVSTGLGEIFLSWPEPFSAALYGFLHPLAEVTGWGNLLNAVPFTAYGSCQAPSGDTLKGSYNCFIYGANPVEGQQALFLVGGYPVVAFGLTALFVIFWIQLKGEDRQYWRLLYWGVIVAVSLSGSEKVGIYLLAIAAPLLLLAHMIASAISYALTAVFMVTIGWAGGPGIIDLIRWSQAGDGVIILLILGVFFAAVYLIIGLLYARRNGKVSLLPGYGIASIQKPFMAIARSKKSGNAKNESIAKPSKLESETSEAKTVENPENTITTDTNPATIADNQNEHHTPGQPLHQSHAAKPESGIDSKQSKPMVGLPVLEESVQQPAAAYPAYPMGYPVAAYGQPPYMPQNYPQPGVRPVEGRYFPAVRPGAGDGRDYQAPNPNNQQSKSQSDKPEAGYPPWGYYR